MMSGCVVHSDLVRVMLIGNSSWLPQRDTACGSQTLELVSTSFAAEVCVFVCTPVEVNSTTEKPQS